MKEPSQPPWLDVASWYYSRVRDEPHDPVSILTAPLGQEVSSENEGTLCLRLEPSSGSVLVLGADGREQGIISSKGILPWLKYVMRRNGAPVWELSLRSLVRKRHNWKTVAGDTWTIDTPFFWWQHLSASSYGATKLLGRVGPTKKFWLVWLEPGSDTHDLLAALGFMHRNWWRS